MSQIKTVVIQLTIEQINERQLNFQFTAIEPKKNELANAIRVGSDKISPMMTRMVDELLTSLRQFENRLTEHGRISPVDEN